MVRAWYHDGDTNNPDEPHMETPGQFLSVQQLRKEIGVECIRFDAEKLDTNPDYLSLKKKRGYVTEDYTVITKDTIHIGNQIEQDYDRRMEIFNTEHMHPDEEIRFVSEGSGYFDMRSRDDRWIRLELSQGDFLIIPAGIYHRFFLDHKKYMKMRRLFSEVPSWVAFCRTHSGHDSIQQLI